jgi:hypothetical protein
VELEENGRTATTAYLLERLEGKQTTIVEGIRITLKQAK